MRKERSLKELRWWCVDGGLGWILVPFTESRYSTGTDLSQVCVVAGKVLRGNRL